MPDSGSTPSIDSPEWKGHVTAKIYDFGRRLDNHDGDLRELRMAHQTTSVEVVRLSGEVQGMRHDLRAAVSELNQSRKSELDELKETLAGKSLSPKEKLQFILIPLIVAFIGVGALVITATHGG